MLVFSSVLASYFFFIKPSGRLSNNQSTITDKPTAYRVFFLKKNLQYFLMFSDTFFVLII